MVGHRALLWVCVVAWTLAAPACSSQDRFAGLDGGGHVQVDGAGEDTPADEPVDAADDQDSLVCGEEELRIGRITPNMLIILDRSNSMTYDGHWDPVREAIRAVTEELESRIAFGLMVFPEVQGSRACDASDANACEPADETLVPCRVRNAGAIERELEDMVTCGGTPTAETLRAARRYFGITVSPTRFPPASSVPSYVLLATDGAPNCNPRSDGASCRCTGPPESCLEFAENCLDDEATYDAIDDLVSLGVTVFVVGITASAWRDVLDRMALLGRTGLAFMAEDPEAMQDAFEEITGSVTTCEFALHDPGPLVDPTLVNFYFDGEAVPMDAEGECDAGWAWTDDAMSRVMFCGPYCDSLLAGDVGGVGATFGCPTLY